MPESLNELELEREKLVLERERLTLERERLEVQRRLRSEEVKVEERSKGQLRVSVSTAVFVAIIALLAGGLLGIFLAGWQLERRSLSRREQVASVLAGTNRLERVEAAEEGEPQKWRSGEGHVWVILD